MTQEVNKKLQEVLEDTLLKNIELTGTVDALSQQLAQGCPRRSRPLRKPTPTIAFYAGTDTALQL